MSNDRATRHVEQAKASIAALLKAPVPVLRRWRRDTTIGERPGEIRIDPQAPKPKLSAISYDHQTLVERPHLELHEIPALLESQQVTWLNVEGLGDLETLEELARIFSVHPLAMEDITQVPQRAKVEDYEDFILVIVHLWTRSTQSHLEQVSLWAGERFVVTFQQQPGDPFGRIRSRLHHVKGRLRQGRADYLLYALLDAVIDGYFPVLDALQVHLETLQDVLREPQPRAQEVIQAAQGELLEVRRALSPVRDVMRSLMTGEWPLLEDTTRVFLRDCRDHMYEVAEQLEHCREIAAGLMDIHLATVSHQANKTMQVLTIIATIFMPLSFLAGIYGMNFDPEASSLNMPELASPIGYPVLLGIMLAIGLGLAWLFWRKGWFK